MQLTKNFTLEELTVTSSKFSNIPNEDQVHNLRLLCENVLQPVRDKFNMQMRITSGFRSPEVNKAIGGASTSQHTKGQAADIVTSDNAKLFHLIRDHFTFDQMIWEAGNDTQPTWVHVSYSETHNRHQCLKMVKIGGKSTYKTI